MSCFALISTSTQVVAKQATPGLTEPGLLTTRDPLSRNILSGALDGGLNVRGRLAPAPVRWTRDMSQYSQHAARVRQWRIRLCRPCPGQRLRLAREVYGRRIEQSVRNPPLVPCI